MPFNDLSFNAFNLGAEEPPGTAPGTPAPTLPTPAPAPAPTPKGSVYSRVFRRLVKQLETDATFRRAVSGDRLLSWKGTTADANPSPPTAGKPVVRLTPKPQRGAWYSADSQVTTLGVDVEFFVAGYAVDEVNDLWDLLVNALRPGNGTLAADLIALGAEDGEVLFSDPAYDHKREEKGGANWYALGQFKLDVLRSIS